MKNGNLVTTIEIKDRNGRVVDTKEVVTYAGLLNRATQEGLKKVYTELIQLPTRENQMTAISMAEVVTEKGVFRDYGDAHPGNVTSMIAPHIIRMAVTRAKARALRDAVNIGVVALEELGGEFQSGHVEKEPEQPTSGQAEPEKTRPPAERRRQAPKPKGQTEPERGGNGGDNGAMTENQRRFLFRLLAERGLTDEPAHEWLKARLNVESLKGAAKTDASDLINAILNGEVEIEEAETGT